MIKNKELSNYDLMILLRMKSLRELRSIELIMKDDNFLSIQNKDSLMNRRSYLKSEYNL